MIKPWIVSFLLVASVHVAWAGDIPDFNSCRSFSYDERDRCLLGLSHSMRDDFASIKKSKIHLRASVAFRDGMLADSDDYSDVGQTFYLSSTPELDLFSDAGYLFTLKVPLTETTGTSIAEKPTKSFGRPELAAFFPLASELTKVTAGIGVRPPLYEASFGNVDSHRIWEISLQAFLLRRISEKFEMHLLAGGFYNTDYTYAVYTPVFNKTGFSYNDETGYFVQHPFTTKSRIGISTVGNSKISLDLFAQYGLKGRTIITGGPSGLGKEVTDIPGIQMTALELNWQQELPSNFAFQIGLMKSLKSEFRLDVAEMANLDDPSYSANLAFNASLRRTFTF